jgi:predicted transcriptional regulator
MPIMASKIQRGIILKGSEWDRVDAQADKRDEKRSEYLRRAVLAQVTRDEANQSRKAKA